MLHSILIVYVLMEGENPEAAADAADKAATAEGHVEETKTATHVPRDNPLPLVRCASDCPMMS